MPWFKVDDDLSFHRKVVTSGNAAMGLWVRAGSWSAQHLTDGFIPNEMISILGTPAQRAKLVKSRLWIEVDGGCQFHEWNENGRQPTSQSVREQRSAAAMRQAKWRANKSADPQVSESRNGVTEPFVTSEVTDAVTPTPSRPDPVSTSNEVDTKTRSRSPRTKADASPEGFDEFWEDAYPRKVAKAKAMAIYRKVIARGVEPADLISAARRYARHLEATGKQQFTAHPTTWLNDGRWEDELPEPAPALPQLRAVGDYRAQSAPPMQGTSSQRANAFLALRKGDRS